MGLRKIWVRRPNASATLVSVSEDDLVDDVRDMILRKYANSLGRAYDAPDVTLTIVSRDQRQVRPLGPEESICHTLSTYYPGGQTVEEALLIDVPVRGGPVPSPRVVYYADAARPVESGTDYFPPMPVSHSSTLAPPAYHSTHQPGAMSVMTTGQVAGLPSPGAGRRPHQRPKANRTHTSSPTGRSGRARAISVTTENMAIVPPPPELPPPPVSEGVVQHTNTPPPSKSKARRSKKNSEHLSLPVGLLSGGVPPINVLIVEDNIINLKLLEAFMKRLKVRWQTAMDGRQAVTKWRSGGFHLVLMDIQLPVMNGLQATREIRRLEKLNGIGVFNSSASSSVPEGKAEVDALDEGDRLGSSGMFKSPVIIVALTASSLQSDRHEALAAGCNDFLTKPVNFVWLERKVMEWGCMQALIDFDGWRKWKDFSAKNDAGAHVHGHAAEKKLTTGTAASVNGETVANGGTASTGGNGNGVTAKKKKFRVSVGNGNFVGKISEADEERS